MNEKELKGAESQEEKPKRKAAPKKKGPSAAERAKLRAEEIRKEMAARKTLVPGDILNGDPDIYAYYHVASGLPSTDRLIATMAQLGYEKCVDGEQMIGMNGGQLYRCPKEITEQRAKEKAARLKK